MEISRVNVLNQEDLVDYLLNTPFASLSYDDKILIKNREKPKPLLQSLIVSGSGGKQNRSFNSSWFDKCAWLTGSSKRNKLYCWPCVLFSLSESVWSKLGYDDLKNLPRSIERHGKSREHIGAMVKINLLGKQNIVNVIDTARIQEINSFNCKVQENRNIMKSLIDATIYLCCQELSFRGHDESNKSDNRGNFKELVSLLSKYDSKLDTFLNNATVFSGTSKSIQNDLIDSISSILEKHFIKEIGESSFFSWQVDETTDITCRSQLSVILRYVVDSKFVERYWGFYDVSSGRTVDDLFKLLSENFIHFDLKNKLVAQTYDGAAVMAGHLNGLQSKVKTIAPQALFTHCHAHVLNLVLSNSCNSIRESRVFFSSLTGFSFFFSKSPKRSNILNEVGASRLPSNSQTRWNFTSRAVFTVSANKDLLIEVFDIIIDSSDFKNDVQTLREAAGLKTLLTEQNFNFF